MCVVHVCSLAAVFTDERVQCCNHLPLWCNPFRVYEWQETKSGRKQKLSARQYVDTAMSFVQKTMQDENIFPTKFGEWTRTRRSDFMHSLLDTQLWYQLEMLDENPGNGSTMMLRSSSP